MTDLEMMERARMYLNKLANGVNPLDESQIPEGDVVNQVRISRCLFYVSDVLRRCIENGGISPAPVKKEKKQPFFLSLEQRNQCPLSSESVTVSVLVQRMNDLIDDNMTALKATQITDWLVDAGLLEILTSPDGHHARRATPEGDHMGIHNEERQSIRGPYTAVFYTQEAQKFILDNLDSILSFTDEKICNEGKPWSPEENDRLRELFRQNIEPDEIARRLQRKPASVRRQLKKIGP